jgi:hypothetical protein
MTLDMDVMSMAVIPDLPYFRYLPAVDYNNVVDPRTCLRWERQYRQFWNVIMTGTALTVNGARQECIWGSWVVTPFIPNLGTGWRSGKLYVPIALSPGKELPVPLFIGGMLSTGVSLGMLDKRKILYLCHESKPDASVVQPVACTLCRLNCPGCP